MDEFTDLLEFHLEKVPPVTNQKVVTKSHPWALIKSAISMMKVGSTFFMQINYPNAKDALHGLKNKTIDRDTFNQIIYAQQENRAPDQKTDLGGALGIHGIGEETDEKLDLHRDENWTNGCIAMKNEEIEELREFRSYWYHCGNL